MSYLKLHVSYLIDGKNKKDSKCGGLLKYEILKATKVKNVW